jgi:hypothetical protein
MPPEITPLLVVLCVGLRNTYRPSNEYALLYIIYAVLCVLYAPFVLIYTYLFGHLIRIGTTLFICMPWSFFLIHNIDVLFYNMEVLYLKLNPKP